jgi:hypothetical protein
MAAPTAAMAAARRGSGCQSGLVGSGGNGGNGGGEGMAGVSMASDKAGRSAREMPGVLLLAVRPSRRR